MDSERGSQLKGYTYDLQKHSQRSTPLRVFNSSIDVGCAKLVPLLFIDRQATLRPKVQWDVQ